jgi:diguanylate cyclase
VISNDSLGQAKGWAESAMKIMAERGIPPHPRNFCLWYEYASGRRAALCQALDEALASNQELPETLLDALFDRFFAAGKECEAVQSTAEGMQAALAQITGSLNEAGSDASRYGELLQDFSDHLRHRENLEEITDLAERVLAETEEVKRHNATIAAQLVSSREEIQRLQQTLEDVRREAALDPVSGFAGQRYFLSRLDQMTKETNHKGDSLSLLLISIDQHQEIVRRLGDQIGDQLLKLIASVLGASIAAKDLAARLAGDQFAVAMPATRLSNALTVGHVFRETLKLKKLVRKNSGEDLGHITVSVGAAQFRIGEGSEQFVQRARAAVDMANREGGNRIVSETALDSIVAVAS